MAVKGWKRPVLAVGLAALAIMAGVAAGRRPATTGNGTSGLNPGIVVASGHGWTDAGLLGPVPAGGSCHYARGAGGAPLPDHHCTPGAVDTAVTDADTADTVCRKGGYTSSVRPPVTLTNPMKLRLLAAYGIPASQAQRYELDHLIPLNAGGASDVRNLWPEPNDSTSTSTNTANRNAKDGVEQYVFEAICDGRVKVTAARNAMANDWTTAVSRLGLPPLHTRR